jgi:hypothetical protein
MEGRENTGVPDLIREAVELRARIKRDEERLALISSVLADEQNNKWSYTDGGLKRTVEVVRRKTLKVDAEKLQAIDPRVYQKVAKTVVDTKTLGAMIADGEASYWQDYAEYQESRPFIKVTEKKNIEETGEDTGEESTNE